MHGTGSETVKIGFKNLSCDACSLVTATTDSGGAYHVSLPPADYLVACLATPFTCSIGDKGLDNEQISISSDLTVDILVTGGTVPPTSASPSPAPPVSGYTLSGHVLTNEGKPVPGINIELVPPGSGGG